MERVYIFINGIKTKPGDPDEWTDRAVTWIHIHTDAKAEKFEYHAGALTRRIHQQDRARSLLKMIKYYRGWDIVLVGHSNGCDLILRALDMIESRNIKEVHLISGACEADPKKNKLNDMYGMIGRLRIYIAGQDKAMRTAKLSQKLVGWLGLGYGTLGGMNPLDARTAYGKECIVYNPGYGHSTWFDRGSIFESTMHSLMMSD